MSYFDAYKARVSPNGESMQDAIIGTTKRQAINNIMNSPTLSYVRLNDNVDTVPVIASDKETFHKRVFLFVPDSIINVGDYVHQTDNAIYLAVDKDADDFGMHPQLIGELCNEVFEMKTEATTVIIGHDDFGRPIPKDIGAQDIQIPCVMTTKIYSSTENSSIPLPDGMMIIKIPYVADKIPKTNYKITVREKKYRLSNISYDNVVGEIGYLEMQLEVET